MTEQKESLPNRDIFINSSSFYFVMVYISNNMIYIHFSFFYLNL